MKKILSLAMVAIMLLGMSLNVYASGETFTGEDLTQKTSKELEIEVDFVPYNEEEVICLGIEWAGFNPKYTESAKTWNPTTLEYDYSDEPGTWSNPDIQNVNEVCPIVKVTNKSNVDLTVSVNFEKNSDYVTRFQWTPDWEDGCEFDEENSNYATKLKFNMGNIAKPGNLNLTEAPSFLAYGAFQLTEKAITDGAILGSVTITIE